MAIPETTGILITIILVIIIATCFTILIAKTFKSHFQNCPVKWLKTLKYSSLYTSTLIISALIICPILHFTIPTAVIYTISITSEQYELDGKFVHYLDTAMTTARVYGPKNSYIDNQTNIRFRVKQVEPHTISPMKDTITFYEPTPHTLPQDFTIGPNSRTALPQDFDKPLSLTDLLPR